VRGQVSLASAYRLKGDFSGAEQQLKSALTRARNNGAQRLVALCLLSLASLHDQLHRPEMLQEARDALAYYRANGYSYETSQALTLLGRYERDHGDLPGALESFQAAADMAAKAQDRAGVAQAHASLGSLLAAQERYPEALEHFQKNLEAVSDPERQGYAALQCGDTLRILGRTAEARAMLSRAAALATKLPALQSKVTRARAAEALASGQFGQAILIARQALKTTLPDPRDAVELEHILGTTLVAQGDARQGRDHCETAVREAMKLNDAGSLLSAQVALAEAHAAMRDHQGALDIFHAAEPVLGTHPESRWRLLALLAGSDSKYAEPAQKALDDLTGVWSKSAVDTYLKRADLRQIQRPLSRRVAAEPH